MHHSASPISRPTLQKREHASTRNHVASLQIYLASLLLLLGLAASASAQNQPPKAQIVCGVDILLTHDMHALPPDTPRIPPQVAGKSQAATITLNAGAGLLANSAALAAWQSAVNIWQGVLNDNVSIVIDGDLAALPPGVLGGTSSATFFAGYTQIRDQMAADRAGDEGILAQLPTLGSFSLLMPPGFTFNDNLTATKANLKALGFDMSGFPGADASITFATGFVSQFDFDPSDGITPGQFDFEAIVVHEIGHALGFISEVDDVDFVKDNGQVAEVRPNTLDMLRFRAGDGAADFTNNPRNLTTGDIESVHMVYDGSQDLGMSTAQNFGDGRQASHWKADELSGTFIGIMDPTISPGDREQLTPNDIRAFGLIGWDVVNGAPITDCNSNTVVDSIDIATGTSQDCNNNLIPDECDISAGTSQDVNSNGIPDECESFSDLELVKTVNDSTPNANDTISYLLKIRNLGPSANTGIVVVDVLPPGVAFVSSTPSAGTTYSSGTGIWFAGSVAVGDSATLTIDVTVTAAPEAMVTNTANILAAIQPDLVSGNNSDSAKITVNSNSVDLELTKTVSDSTPNVGDTISYVIRLRNLGPGAGTGIVVTDSLPAGVVHVSNLPSAGTTYDNATGLWVIGNVAAGDSAQLTINVDVTGAPGAMITNNAGISGADQADPASANNSDSAKITINVISIVDCNNNSVADSLDIANGTSQDCNNNSIPDECDIALGTSQDADLNGIPDECTVDAGSVPRNFLFSAKAYPNPFNPNTLIVFELPQDGLVDLRVFDVSGKHVTTLAQKHYTAGRHEVRWAGRNDAGEQMASGVYYLSYTANGKSVRSKLTLLK